MATVTKKKVEAAIAEHLAPPLVAEGFTPASGDTFYRVKGPLVHVVAVWSGRSRGALYLAYFVNLLADAGANTLGSYKVGDRPGRNDTTSVVWNAESAEDLAPVLSDMSEYVIDTALPFFDYMNLERFVETIQLQGSMFKITQSIGLGILGKYDAIHDICEADRAMIAKREGAMDEAKLEGIRSTVEALDEASGDPDKFQALVREWSAEVLERLPKA